VVPLNILIVDDDPAFLRTATDALRKAGYEVVGSARCAADAREATRSLAPDAVLLDVNLPDGDGIALASELLGERPSIRILLTSSDSSAAPPRVVARSGAVGFMTKTDLFSVNFAALFGL
jgi:DNA-binding NarL/FixJ family response regulator